MDRKEQSREEWERDLRDVQQGVSPAEWLRADQIMAQKLSASPAPISDFAHLVCFLLSALLLVVAFVIFASDIAHRISIGSATLVVCFFLALAAFRRKESKRLPSKS